VARRLAIVTTVFGLALVGYGEGSSGDDEAATQTTTEETQAQS
jgi:hypothetical protein